VAGRTLTRKPGVVHDRGPERRKVGMAGIALRCRRYMRRRLRQPRPTGLMAGRAIIYIRNRRVGVRVHGRRPRNRTLVTGIALCTRWRMRNRLHLRVLR
jgi:hypothetical protein